MVVRAAVLREVGAPLVVEELTLTPPGPGQVRVALHATGVCHSDLSLANGTLAQQTPAVLGHEGAGRVIELGPGVNELAVGDPVVLNWAPACRECWFCEHGQPYLCAHADAPRGRPYGELADGTPVYPSLGVGGFAEQTVLAASACVRVPEDVPLAQAAVLGCAVLTGVGAVTRSARVRPGESVVVVGLGAVGMCAVQGARLAGAEPIIAVDPVPEKAELATRLGAGHVLAPAADLSRTIRGLTGGRGADHAIECVGRAQTIRAAWSATRRGGRVTVVGLGSHTDEVRFTALELGYQGRVLAGCLYGDTDPAVDLPDLVAHWRAGRLDLAALIGPSIGLTGVQAALDALGAGTGARAVLRPTGG